MRKRDWRGLQWLVMAALAIVFATETPAQPSPPLFSTNAIVMVIKGKVEIARRGAQRFDPAQVGMEIEVGDRIRVGDRSQLILRLPDQSEGRFDEGSNFQVQPPRKPAATGGRISMIKGIFYLFHRDRPSSIEVETQRASAAIRGTEFNLQADEEGATVVTVIDGEVELSNEVGAVILKNLEQGVAEPGRQPVRRAAVDYIGAIQWTFYYPAVLDASELDWGASDRGPLQDSLDAYRSGDLLQALAAYPAGRQPASDAEKVYLGALLVAVGQVDDAQPLLGDVAGENERLAKALRQMIATVKLEEPPALPDPMLATERLADSYRLQFNGALSEALESARKAVEKSPQFGFGWARVAELEFSFGRTGAAREAIQKALQFSPRNAQAIAVNGFLLAAQNKIRAAIAQFESAMMIDGGLANAWVGRGLCRIRSGDLESGRQDLTVAATLEPQRALFRSYLAKALALDGDRKLAARELEIAERLDSGDSTVFLYKALLKQQNNQINEAIDDLEKSQDLVGNRQLYRSQLLLDQDRAVRSANLAHIYRDAGMIDWSVREASRAVAKDYANFSAHLFLANSYDQLRDPNRINLRYETPAEAEYLIANILAPVGAGLLSQSISQGEYSKLFEADRLGVTSYTEYLSRGAWYQNGAQFGQYGNSAYALEGIYRTDPGQRPNNDIEERSLTLHLKQQITEKDTVYLRLNHNDTSGGDLAPSYAPTSAVPGLRFRERQEPIVTAGYHHEWSPGMHTLLVAHRLDDSLWVNNPSQNLYLILFRRFDPDGPIGEVLPMMVTQQYRSHFEIYSAEAQQIFQTTLHTTTLGARFQKGDISVENLQTNPRDPSNIAQILFRQGAPVGDRAFEDISFERFSAYGYHQWQILDSLMLVAGVSYDRVIYPANFRSSPVTNITRTADQVSPKTGLVWTPWSGASWHGAYTRSLAGATIDQSYTIEPTQVAGINQSFRAITPDAIAGAGAGSEFETCALSFNQRFPTRSYLGLGAEWLNSAEDRLMGAFEVDNIGAGFPFPSSIRETVRYRERSLAASFDQLLGRVWSIGARYKVTESDLDVYYPESTTPRLPRHQTRGATLHNVNLRVRVNAPSGFFALGEAAWYEQSNTQPGLAGDEFWHLNAFVGYRFLQRRGEVAVGVLNITDQDYRLNPLNPYFEPPRERTLVVQARLAF